MFLHRINQKIGVASTAAESENMGRMGTVLNIRRMCHTALSYWLIYNPPSSCPISALLGSPSACTPHPINEGATIEETTRRSVSM